MQSDRDHHQHSESRNASHYDPSGCRHRRPTGHSRFLIIQGVVAVVSLVWLLARSGAQPRRLQYPCQRAAAANVSYWALLMVPGMIAHRFRKRIFHWLWAAAGIPALAGFMLIAGGLVFDAASDPQPEGTTALPPARSTLAVPAVVSAVRDAVDPLTSNEVEQMVRRAVQDAGGLSGIQPGATVVIKPNLVQTQWPAGEGVTTDPRVVRAVVRLAQEAGAGRVVIAEGSASSRYGDYSGRDVTFRAFKDSGYDTDGDRLDDETGVELYDLNDTGGLDLHAPDRVALVTIPNGVIRTQYWVPRMLLRPGQGGFCDYLISAPTFKNHQNGGVTLSLKNRVGGAPSDIYHADFAPYTQQMKWSLVHSSGKFPRSVVDGGAYVVPPATDVENTIVQYTIVDLNLVRPQDFVVVDGLVGINNGPVGSSGNLIKASPPRKLIVAGKDSVAVDTICTLAMGYDPVQIPHIAWADYRGLGTMDTTLITVMGDHVASIRRNVTNGYGGCVRVESTAPVLDGVTLSEGQQVSGVLAVSGNASDNVSVAKVELRIARNGIDEAIISLPHPEPSFTLGWDSNAVVTGTYSATVSAYDSAMNEASVTHSIEVVRPPVPVIVLNTHSLKPSVLVTRASSDGVAIRNTGVGTLNYQIQADQPWVHVAPAGGAVDGSQVTMELSYESGMLPPGIHAAHITVSDPAAYNNPQVIAVELTVRPSRIDFDADGDVDQDDFGAFQLCYSGEGITQDSAACQNAKLDADADVDQNDLLIFQNCMSGPGTLVSSQCAE